MAKARWSVRFDVGVTPPQEAVTGQIFTDEAARRMYPALFRMQRPRPVRLIWRGWYFHLLFIIVAACCVSLARRAIATPATDARSTLWFFLAAVGITYWGYRLARTWYWDRRLLADGEVSVGVVTGESLVGYRIEPILLLQVRPCWIDYSFRDGVGNEYRGRGLDYSQQNFKDAPIPVFYDPANPRYNVALGCSLHDLRNDVYGRKEATGDITDLGQ